MRMGQHAWLLLATVVTELLVIRKWGKHIYTAPFPKHIKWAWTIGATLLILYPSIRVRPGLQSCSTIELLTGLCNSSVFPAHDDTSVRKGSYSGRDNKIT